MRGISSSLLVVLIASVALAAPASRPFMTGVDANYLLDMQRKGTKWTDRDGAPVDPLAMLAAAGCDSFRVRLWTGDEGANGLAYATETATRAQTAGLRPYLVIFLSEDWADMVKQPAPAIWQKLGEAEKCAAIEAYSARVTKHLLDAGVAIDLFEIGNEIDFGLCGVFEEEWSKRVSVEYMRQNIWSKMAPMIRAAQTGVRKARPEAKFILHLAQWANADYCIAFWRFMIEQGVAVDLAGLSYFPTSVDKPEARPLAFLASQAEKIAAVVERKIVLCETAYPTSPQFTGQFADWNKPVDGYPLDADGQGKWLADLLAMTRSDPHIAGVFYWSPEWCGPGMWEAFALFDTNGRVRRAMRSFQSPGRAGGVEGNSRFGASTVPGTLPATLPSTTTRASSSSRLPNVYFGNLHAHTGYSDGVGTPAEAFAYGRDVGKLDFLAITEHNHLMGGDKASAAKRAELYAGPGAESLVAAAELANRDGQFVAIAGQEFSSMSKGNHVNVFDVREVIDVPNGAFDRLLGWLDAHRDGAGDVAVVQLNHPALGRPGKTIDRNEFGRDDFGGDAEWVRRMGAVTSLIELLNGEPLGDPADRSTTRATASVTKSRRSPQVMEEHYQLYLRLGFRIGPTGNQDNHHANWGDATDTRTGVWADSLTRRDLLAALRARRVYATEDKNLKLVARIAGHLCGDVIPLGLASSVARSSAASSVDAPPTAVSIECFIADADEPDAVYDIEVFAGRVGKSVPLAQSVHKFTQRGNTAGSEIIGQIPRGEAGFFYLRVTQRSEQGVDRAWTSPVWVKPDAAR